MEVTDVDADATSPQSVTSKQPEASSSTAIIYDDVDNEIQTSLFQIKMTTPTEAAKEDDDDAVNAAAAADDADFAATAAEQEQELHTMKEALFAEKKLSNDLKQRLQLKAISINCQLSETENLLDTSKVELEDAIKKNTVLQNNILAMKKEKESLLERTAALARRDQIQKASIVTSNAEIEKLYSTIVDFQDKFQSLASGLVPVHNVDENDDDKGGQGKGKVVASFDNNGDDDENNNEAIEDQKIQHQGQQQQHEQNEVVGREEKKQKQQQQQWNVERTILNGCIQKLKSDSDEMKSKFIQTLTKHQSAWHSERDALQSRIAECELLLMQEKKDKEKDMGMDMYNSNDNDNTVVEASSSSSSYDVTEEKIAAAAVAAEFSLEKKENIETADTIETTGTNESNYSSSEGTPSLFENLSITNSSSSSDDNAYALQCD